MNKKLLETSIECSLTEKSLNFSRNPTSKSWANNLESQVKYHERLMKPLKTNPKLKRAATVAKTSEKLFEEPMLDPGELGFSKLMNQVKEIAKISKHHRKLVKDEVKEPEMVEENILASKLSDKTNNYIKLAKEATEPDQQVSMLSESREQTNAEKQALQRERNNKIALQMSRTKTIPKQLNTNVHFRHAKRKILVLRTFDSLPNRRETLKGLMEDVEKKKEEGLEEPNLMRMKSMENPLVLASPPISKKFMHAKTINTIGDSSSKPKKIHLQNFLESSTVSIFGSPKHEEETLPKSQNALQIKTVCSEESFEGELPYIQKKNIFRIPSLAQASSIILEEDAKNTSRSIVLTNRKGCQMSDVEKECKQYLRDYYPSNRKDSLNFFDDESIFLKGALSSRSGGGKNKPRPEYTVPKQSKALKDELILNLREDNLKIEDRLLILKSKTRQGNRKITSTKQLRTVPSSRGCHHIIQPSKPSKNLRGRGAGDQKQRSNVMNNNSELNLTTIRNLIEKSYEGERFNQEDTQTILKSYGFQDTIGKIIKPKSNNKFSVLEGYQGEYLKGEIAKVQRQIDASLRKSQKSLVIL